MKKTEGWKRVVAAMTAGVMVLSMAACGAKETKKSVLNPKEPVTVTIWNYYNGDQLNTFEDLIDEFNSTEGVEKGIVAVSVSQGDINTLADSLINAVEGKAGAEKIPTLAAVYVETAYILDEQNALVPLDDYFTEEELKVYVPGFVDEGRFNENNEILTFPMLKSTEAYNVNKTDWEVFEKATGVSIGSVKTAEDLTKAAEVYYNWTDGLTPDVREDGKALYGRDSVGNYIYLGAYQLGHDIFPIKDGELALDMNRDVFKTLWDNYYVPYINGYFGSFAKFRSEDAKTGRILSLTSSTSSTGYLPTEVINEDDTSYPIEMEIREALPFADAKKDVAIQQGANYCLLQSTEAEQEGAVELLKWFTESERNMQFAVTSGYSPVTTEANDQEAILNAYGKGENTAMDKMVLDALLMSADCFANKETYATKPFKGSKDVRQVLEQGLEQKALDDRAAVVEAIQDGATREEAVAPYITDEYFDAWFTDLRQQVTSLTE